MKRRILGGIITLGVLLASCHTDTPARKLLRRADSLLNAACTDSARTLLDSLSNSILHEPEATRMYYTLLTIKAQDKAYIPHTSDSLIRQVLHYYQDRNDKTHLPEALYYAGRVYSDLENAPQALSYYQLSADALVENKQENPRLMSLIYCQIGTLYLYQELYDEAPSLFREAYQYDLLLKDTISLIYDLRDIGRTFTVNEELDSAIHYYQQASKLAKQLEDKTLYGSICGEAVELYMQRDDHIQAYQNLQIAQKNIDSLSRPMYYTNAAYYYYHTSQLDSAQYYYQQMRTVNSYSHQSEANQGLAYIACQKGESLQALEYFKQHKIYEDSLQKTIRKESIRKIDTLYKYNKTLIENEDLKEKSFLQLCGLVGSIVFVIIAILVAVIFWQKYQRAQQYILLQKEKLKRQQEEKRNRQNRISTTEEKNAILHLTQTSIYKKLHPSVNGEQISKLTEEEWIQLEETVNNAYPRFIQRLNELHPLSIKEQRVCLLIKADVPPSRIADLVYSTKQGISSLRERLYKKLTGEKGKPKD